MDKTREKYRIKMSAHETGMENAKWYLDGIDGERTEPPKIAAGCYSRDCLFLLSYIDEISEEKRVLQDKIQFLEANQK